jgi:hypothetical protein
MFTEAEHFSTVTVLDELPTLSSSYKEGYSGFKHLFLALKVYTIHLSPMTGLFNSGFEGYFA